MSRFGENRQFGAATITGNAWFYGATITGDARFGDATMTGNLHLGAAWNGRCLDLASVMMSHPSCPEINFDGATFANSRDDPRSWFGDNSSLPS